LEETGGDKEVRRDLVDKEVSCLDGRSASKGGEVSTLGQASVTRHPLQNPPIVGWMENVGTREKINPCTSSTKDKVFNYTHSK
jgi:hypothetical protein